MRRGGLIEHWHQDFWPSKDRCSETATGGADGNVIQPISVADMQGSFYLLFFGCGLAGVIFLIERYLHKRKMKLEGDVIRPYLN